MSADYVLLIARIFFAGIFLISAPENFNREKIKPVADKGVPMASFLVPASSAMALIGALGILFGIEAKWSAWLIVIFLVPVTLIQHNFWSVDDAMKRRMQRINFLKNLSMLGGALYIAIYGSGALSLDRLF